MVRPMGRIVLKNNTGRRAGTYIRYEYGTDLFGYLYLDVSRAKKHRAQLVRKLLFDNPREFICTLDDQLYQHENLHYLQQESA